MNELEAYVHLDENPNFIGNNLASFQFSSFAASSLDGGSSLVERLKYFVYVMSRVYF